MLVFTSTQSYIWLSSYINSHFPVAMLRHVYLPRRTVWPQTLHLGYVGGLFMKKLQFGQRLYITLGSEASSKCCSVSASSLPLVRNSQWLLFQAWHLRDVPLAVVTGSLVVEQKRKQEVNTAEPQVVFRRPARVPFVIEAQSKQLPASDWSQEGSRKLKTCLACFYTTFLHHYGLISTGRTG